MRRRTRALALVAVGVAVAVPAVALAGGSTAPRFNNKANTVSCGIMIHGPNTPPMAILCSAGSIPAPKHTTSADGDPGFVTLGRTGKPQTIRTSQNDWAFNPPKVLKNGTLWTSPPVGVSCNVAGNGTVLCFNTQNHGFLVSKKHYQAF